MTKKRKNKKKLGRPSKLTPQIREEIVSFIKAGVYIEDACVLAGIDKSTYYAWMKKANKSKRPNKYTRFYEEVTKAKAWSEARDVAIIAMHSETNWRAAAWKLERKSPERWGKKKVSRQIDTNAEIKCNEYICDNESVSLVNLRAEIKEAGKSEDYEAEWLFLHNLKDKNKSRTLLLSYPETDDLSNFQMICKDLSKAFKK